MRLGARYVPHGGPLPTGHKGAAALQTVQPRLQGALVVEGGREQHSRTDQFELEPRGGGTAHLGEPGVDQVRRAAQLGGAEDGGLRLHPRDDIRRSIDQPLLPRIRHGGQDHQVAQPLQKVGHEPARVVAALDDLVDELEGGGSVRGGEGVDDGVEERPVRIAEEGGGHGIRHTFLARTCQQLVHDGHGVPNGSRPGPHDEGQHAVGDLGALLPAHLAEVVAQGAGRHQPEGVVVRTRPNGADDLLGLGGREDELEMLRGSSTTFSRALNPAEVTMCASSMM